MFEKEAEEYGEKDLGGKYLSSVVAKDKLHAYKLGQYDGFIAGAEFGYNKANEWHDLRKDPNDLPIFETELLCQKYSGRCFVGYYHYNDNKFYPYEKGNSYDVTDVIAWKEIVLPELKESE